MKKFLGALFVLLMIFSTNAHAAKPAPPVILADLNAKTFFANLGYDVDCSYWENTRDGKQLFIVLLLEEPLVIIKDEPNIEVYSEMNTEKIVEVVLYLKNYAEKKSAAAMVAKVLNALDEEFFKANGDAINQGLEEFIDTQAEKTIADKYTLSAEKLDEQIFTVHIKPAQMN